MDPAADSFPKKKASYYLLLEKESTEKESILLFAFRKREHLTVCF